MGTEICATSEGQPAHAYMLDASQTEHERLLRLTQRLAEGLCPGHRLVNDPHYASFDPPLPTYEAACEGLFAAAQRRGATVDVGRRLPQLCEEAGLRVVDARGSFSLVTPAREWIEATRVLLSSARRASVSQSVASEVEVDTLIEALARAESQEFRSAVGHLYVNRVAQTP